MWTATDRAALAAINMIGTDLGVSFSATLPDGRRRLVFLFGDTPTTGKPFTGRWDEDSIATASIDRTDRAGLPELEWMTRPDGEFLSLIVPGYDLRAMEVPLDGVQTPDGRTFVFLNDGWLKAPRSRHQWLVCAEAILGDFARFEPRFARRTDRFLNVSVTLDPNDPTTAWVFGTGIYRKSPIYLARVPASEIDDFDAWRFWKGRGEPLVDDESLAEAIVDGVGVGELSVRYVEPTGCWVMAYQRAQVDAHGQAVYLRFALHPTGPWSDELAVIKPDIDNGEAYTRFVHAKESVAGFDDGLADPGREDKWGDPYGFYIVSQWCRRVGDRVTLVATLSTWNPYQVSLIEIDLMPAQLAAPAPAATTRIESAPVPDFNHWATEGDGFATRLVDGEPWLDSHGEASSTGSGVQSVEVIVPAGARWLTFQIRGVQGVARLYDRADRIVRESRGRAGSADDARKVAWRIDHLVGHRVRIALEDHLNGPSGWVAMTRPGFTSQSPRD